MGKDTLWDEINVYVLARIVALITYVDVDGSNYVLHTIYNLHLS